MAFIMGVLPLVLSTGAGSEMRRAMGVAVFSGMIGVTVFGLFLTPVFYVLLRTAHRHEAADASRQRHQRGAGANRRALDQGNPRQQQQNEHGLAKDRLVDPVEGNHTERGAREQRRQADREIDEDF